MSRPRLICVAGPTAVGKTSLTVEWAKELNTDIVSFDSRQFYQELAIGTAKPTPEEMDGVTHHFVNSHSIHEPLNAGSYAEEAYPTLLKLFEEHDTLILTGGSGLYLDAVLFGFDELPPIPQEIREKYNHLYRERGLEHLQELVSRLDPTYYSKVDKANHTRLIRALEVIEVSGRPFSELRQSRIVEHPFDFEIHILDRPRAELHDRINRRVDIMMEQGLLEEVKTNLPHKELAALQTVGYREFYDYFEGHISLEQAIENVKTATRRYAKRQLTWFRRYENAIWHDLSLDSRPKLL